MSGFYPPKQYPLLVQLISQQNTIYVYGPRGSGKTTVVHQALQDANMEFRRINFIQCVSKQSILEAIQSEIQSLWHVKIAPATKFSQLVLILSDFVAQAQPIERKGYIVIDAPLNLEGTYINKLLKLAEIRSRYHRFDYILICNVLPNIPLPLGAKFLLESLSKKDQAQVIAHHIAHKALTLKGVNEADPGLLKTSISELSKDVISTFGIITNDLNQLQTLGWDLFEHFIYKCVLSRGSRFEYHYARKILLGNPSLQINSKNFKDIFEQRNIKDQQLTIEKNNAIKSLTDEQIKLPKIPALILLSAYYAQRNPDRTDRYIFRDKKKNTKSKAKEIINPKKKVTMQRLIAIAQSLLSMSTTIINERDTFNQSALFYQSIQRMIDLGYLKSHHLKSDELNIKIECLITEKQAYLLAKELDIKFNEFLYRQ